ncbi:probable WD repeat-containing protein 74 at C-terminar half [Coccomyxa sp. Obi]|nr:probable WD repeat-containing protein 74 at C-terminar half [Coccomyxa sp. Obi]
MPKRKDPVVQFAGVPVRLLVSDDLGIVKGVQAPGVHRFEDAKVVNFWGEPDRAQNAAGCLAVSDTTPQAQGPGLAGSFLAAVGRTAGQISLLDGQTGQQQFLLNSHSSNSSSMDGSEESVVGLRFLTTQACGQPQLLSCTDHGSVHIHAPALGSEGEIWEPTAQWTVPANVSSMEVSKDESCMAVGCQGTELNIWDVKTQQQTFLAKSAKPNRIGLVDPPWCSAVAFLPGSDNSKVLVGTGKSKLRLYDIKHGRRPVLDLTFGQSRITSLAAEPDGNRVWVANAAGQIEVLDLQAGQMAGAAKGATGSVRCLALHPTEPLLASVGLDRFLRVHSTVNRKQLCAVYLKQKLNGVTFCPALYQQEAAPEPEDEVPAAADNKRDKRKKHSQ